ncbi:HEPN domain-containing protein [Asanoa sp. NPDC049573]|uniref:ApeA N-terminal domain 1-containing protein n=1 Tax=Asanoa sp. NPDC049573 TaxID=3155396 RepID=UPI003439AEE2
MNELNENGIFWLPEAEDNPFPGHLEYSPEAGCHLNVVSQPSLPRRAESVPRILGVVRNQKVTLLGCQRFGESFYGSGLSYERYLVRHFFSGLSYIPEDRPVFTTIQAQYHNFAEWLEDTGFAENESRPPGDLAINYIKPESLSSEFSKGKVFIDFLWKEGDQGSRRRSIEELPIVRLQYDEPQQFDEILRDANIIENLITLCVDSPSPRTAAKFQRADLPQRSLAGNAFPNTQDPIEYFNEPVEKASKAKVVDPHSMLIRMEDIGGVEALSRWLDRAGDLGYVLGLLMSARTTQWSYVENRFFNLAGAAEAFHRLAFGGTRLPDDRFALLRGLAIASMPDSKGRSWIKSHLRFNEPTLAHRLEELASTVSPVADAVVDDQKSWAVTVAEVRNKLVHMSSPGHHGFDGGTLLFLYESVFAVTRAAILRYAGVEDGAIRHIATSHRTTWYKEGVKEALQQAREVLARSKLGAVD